MASLDGLHVEANGRDGAVPHVSTDGLVRSCFGSRFQISAGSAEGRTYSIVNSPPCATRSACKIWNVHHTGGGAYREHSEQRRLAGVLEPDHGDVHLGVPAGSTSALIINTNSLHRRCRRPSGAIGGVSQSQAVAAFRTSTTAGCRLPAKEKIDIPEQADEPIIQPLQQPHNERRRERAMLARKRSSKLGPVEWKNRLASGRSSRSLRNQVTLDLTSEWVGGSVRGPAV